MTYEELNRNRVKVLDRPGATMQWVGIALGALGVAVVVFSESNIAGVLIAFAAAALWFALRYSDVATEAVFDRAKDRVQVRHVSLGKPQAEWEGAIADVENVVLEAAPTVKKGEDSCRLRPALVVDGQSLPLTFGRYAAGRKPEEIALALRRFLGLPRRDLIEDSIRLAVRDPFRTRPAVNLARFGKKMAPDEAAAYVEQLKAEAEESQAQPAG